MLRTRDAAVKPLIPVLLAAALAGSGSRAQSADELDKNRFIERAREFVSAVELHEDGPEGGGQTPQLCSHPVLVFSDQPRANPFGTVWVWGLKGRPAAIIEVYISADSNYANVMHAISEARVSGRSQAGWRWRPESAGLTLARVADAGPVADGAEARLIQCRSLAKGFAIIQREYYDPEQTPTRLRLLPQPIHRYADKERGIVDGALFAFVHGETNPEAILVLEARRMGDETQWHFGFVRLGHAEMTATRGAEDVWHAERIDGLPPASSPYFYISPALVTAGE